MRIDAHHHLWHHRPEEFAWIDEASSAIRRDFLLADLAAEMQEAGVDGAISVQARPSLAETRFLLEMAAASNSIVGVVGWAPLADEGLPALLDTLRGEPKLVGLREVTQVEAPGYLDQPEVNRGLALLTARGLSYDLLLRADQLPEATRFVDHHPMQRFVLDHAAKPPIARGELEPWCSDLRELAKRENVWCKMSGLVTEANWQTWTPETLRPYLDACVEAFGPRRLMAGSDWPVCLLATTYRNWWDVLDTYFSAWSSAEREDLFADNALRAYGCARPQPRS